jgi:hypothetical protein
MARPIVGEHARIFGLAQPDRLTLNGRTTTDLTPERAEQDDAGRRAGHRDGGH